MAWQPSITRVCRAIREELVHDYYEAKPAIT